MTTIFLSISSTIFYLTATVILIHSLTHQKVTNTAPNKTNNKATFVFPAIMALLIHAILLQKLIITESGYNFGFFYSLTLIAWVVTLSMIVAALRSPIESVGAIVFPITILSILLALLLPPDANQINQLSTGLQIHVLLSIISYGILSLAALQSILLAFQEHQLRNHKSSLLINTLPSLQTMEKLMFNMIALGFIILTAALISGFMFADSLLKHKIIFAVIAWLVFGTLLVGRKAAGWRGPQAIRWTLGGIFLLMLAFFGSRLVLELVLHR